MEVQISFWNYQKVTKNVVIYLEGLPSSFQESILVLI